MATLDEARALGLPRYSGGRPCRAGHVADRYVKSKGCVVCIYEREKARRAGPEGKARSAQYTKSYWKGPSGKAVRQSPTFKAYNAERAKRWNKAAPNLALSKALREALIRHPTENPVTQAELVALWHRNGGKCSLSGIQMVWASGVPARLNAMALDRIDRALGYTAENTRLICHGLNMFKGSWSDAEMLEMAAALLEHQKWPA
jgi:hypothetical protein